MCRAVATKHVLEEHCRMPSTSRGLDETWIRISGGFQTKQKRSNCQSNIGNAVEGFQSKRTRRPVEHAKATHATPTAKLFHKALKCKDPTSQDPLFLPPLRPAPFVSSFPCRPSLLTLAVPASTLSKTLHPMPHHTKFPERCSNWYRPQANLDTQRTKPIHS